MTPLMSVTIDIEDWYHIPSVCGSSFSKYNDTTEFFEKWQGRFDYISGPTSRVIDILAEFGIRATFFIVAEVIERYKGLIQTIVKNGHEIASHGYDHRCYIDSAISNPVETKNLFREKMAASKDLLETVSRSPVTGFRVPSAYVTGWMLDILEEIGFEYDSSVSVNSLYNKTDSTLEGVDRVPYFPQKGELIPGPPREILEIPWPYLKIGPFKIPCAGGPFLRFLGGHFIYQGLRQSMSTGSSFMYFHPLDIARDTFPASFSSKRPFYWIIKGKVVENRLRNILSKLDDVKYVTMSEYSSRWKRKLQREYL